MPANNQIYRHPRADTNMSMSICGATITVVKAKGSGMECAAYQDELHAVLSMINNGALGRGDSVSWYGSHEHKAALDSVERQLADTRSNIAEQEAAEAMPEQPPCAECGAMTRGEAETKCHCGGDKDDCHGTRLWPD